MQQTFLSHRARRRETGFTLLELIVVITIIGLLSSIVLVSTKGAGPKARRTKVVADLDRILTVAQSIQGESSRWPESIEEMVDAKDENGQPYMQTLGRYPKDPWQQDYVYTVEDGQATVKCLGSDGAEGGEGEAADVVRPELTTP